MSTRRRKTPRFSCKQCSHVDWTQEAIAVHYLQRHLNVNFCTLSEPLDESESSHRKGKKDAAHDEQVDVLEIAPQDDQSDNRQQATRRTKTLVDGGKEFGAVVTSRRTAKRKGEEMKIVRENSGKTQTAESNSGPTGTSLTHGDNLIQCTRRGRGGNLTELEAKNSTDVSENELGRGKRKKCTPKRFITECETHRNSDKRKSNLRCTGESEHTEERKLPSTEQEPNAVGDKEEETTTRTSPRRRFVVPRQEKHTPPSSVSPKWKNVNEKMDVESLGPKRRKSARVLSKSQMKLRQCDKRKGHNSDTLDEKIKRLPIPYTKFKIKLEEMVSEWNMAQQNEKKASVKKCVFEGCNLDMREDELRIHVSCHVTSMDGLRCPHCSFLCLYWRHMRKHLRKEHDLMPSRVYHCDQHNCHCKFIRFNQLRKHVMDKHYKGELADRLLSGAYDPNDFVDISEDKQDLVPSQSSKRKRSRDFQADEVHKRKKRLRLLNKDEDRETVERKHRKKVTFVCDLCLSRFRDEDAKETHRKGHLVYQETGLLCLECLMVSFDDSAALKDHYQREHKRNLMRYQCKECPFATDRFNQMNSHQVMHTGQKEVMCDQCGKLLANQYNLKVHKFRRHSTDEQKTVVCPACSYRCADKSVLRDHIKQHHKSMLKNPIYHQCSHCDYVGHKLKSLQFHMRIHNEQRSFKCHLCPYAGKTKNHLKIHLQTHADFATASCPHCNFKGASKKRLSEHLMRQHLKIEPYLCKICQWRTAYSGNMWKHINHHKKTLGDDMPDEPAIVELELLKNVELPEMPKAPTGKSRRKSVLGVISDGEVADSMRVCRQRPEEIGLYVQRIVKKTTEPATDLQILQIAGESEGKAYVPGEIQIVQIQDDSLVQMQNHAIAQKTDPRSGDQSSRMEILVSQEAVENGCESEKNVELLGVGEDGTIFTSMNPDVEVAVLALAHLEPGANTDGSATAVGDGSQITILQTASQNGEAGAVSTMQP